MQAWTPRCLWRGGASVQWDAQRPTKRASSASVLQCQRSAIGPDAIFVPPDFVRYKAASQVMREIFRRCSSSRVRNGYCSARRNLRASPMPNHAPRCTSGITKRRFERGGHSISQVFAHKRRPRRPTQERVFRSSDRWNRVRQMDHPRRACLLGEFMSRRRDWFLVVLELSF